jgi:hypothetical protein
MRFHLMEEWILIGFQKKIQKSVYIFKRVFYLLKEVLSIALFIYHQHEIMKVMNLELGKIWKEMIVVSSRYFPILRKLRNILVSITFLPT